MLKHDQLWRAVDRYADAYGMTISGLARTAGLDPTSFNPSKRQTKEGKRRWPSVESIAKVLEATGGNMAEFVSYLQDVPGAVLSRNIPFLSFCEAKALLQQGAEKALFDDRGFPLQENWEVMVYPDVDDADIFGIEITTDHMAPVYDIGTVLLISPNASIRRLDRVFLSMENGDILVRQLVRQTAHRIDLALMTEPDNPDGIETIMARDVAWMSRIVWASQ